ncbi:hypothetical protein J3R82DRAFT_3197 [Butyriboletus roseoflavus]|nr:hypothetical protein J3R82DRAFT_3197 [Butyriboletus roseoflavus]
MPKVYDFTHMLWNKIKRDPSAWAHTSYISKDDIVVFVVGPTGSGKSWFTKAATKSDLVRVSRDSHPFTGEVQAIRCELNEEAKTKLQEGVKSIIFVDTPSFLTGYDHPDANKEIRRWLSRTEYQPRSVGVIYMHRVETDPAHEPMRNHLKEFAGIIPQIGDGHLPQRAHIVISYDKTSSNISESKITERRSKLCTEMASLGKFRWQPSIHQRLFQGEPEVAWKAVEELFSD